MDSDTKKSLATALIQCHFDYACSSWFSGLTKGTKNKLQVCQNKLIRFTLGLTSRTHLGSEHFKTVGWLPVAQRVEQIKLNHMFKIYNGVAPSYLSENFKLVREHHFYQTRASAKNFILPGVNSAGRDSFYYTGAKAWNELPNAIKSVNTISDFKMQVKKHLFQKIATMESAEFLFY